MSQWRLLVLASWTLIPRWWTQECGIRSLNLSVGGGYLHRMLLVKLFVSCTKSDIKSPWSSERHPRRILHLHMLTWAMKTSPAGTGMEGTVCFIRNLKAYIHQHLFSSGSVLNWFKWVITTSNCNWLVSPDLLVWGVVRVVSTYRAWLASEANASSTVAGQFAARCEATPLKI